MNKPIHQIGNNLPLDRCPHCNIAIPRLDRQWQCNTAAHDGTNQRFCSVFRCMTCGGLVIACSPQNQGQPVSDIWPKSESVAADVPERARYYLSHAIASLHAPPGAVMLAASAVDAMLREKGYKNGSLYARIDQAATDHLITSEMAVWAHEIRLDANDQRHADEGAALPNEAAAKKAIAFATALAEFLYVLPARVARGRKPEQAT